MADSKLREMNEIVRSPENRWKNPVSLLMEAAAQVGESVTFDDIDELSLSNMKLFTCEAKVGRLLKCKGTGQNKKIAKATAAEQVFATIGKMSGVRGNSSQTSQPRTPSSALQRADPTVSQSLVGGGIHGSPIVGPNPIGSLQEMCMKNNWSPPVYDLLRESGEAHTKTFIYECQIESLVAQGQGKTKKAAKKIAAENMLSMIGEMGPINSPSPVARPSRNPFRNFPDQGPGISGATGATPQRDRGPLSSHRTPSPASFLSSSLYDFVDLDKPSCEDISPSCFLEDISDEFCKKLKDKGKQSGFEAEYYDLSEKGLSGNYLCFVRLNTEPAAVCSGMGPSKTSAHESAAKNALHYLNTACS